MEDHCRNGSSISYHYNSLAKNGMDLLLKNDFEGSQKLFLHHRKGHYLMAAGASCISFMNALMTFEDKNIHEAGNVLKDAIKFCSTELNWVETFRRFAGYKDNVEKESKADHLMKKIVVADCHLYIAVLSFLGQEMSSFIKAGWNLRKSWKSYEKLFKEIQEDYDVLRKTYNLPPGPFYMENPSSQSGSNNQSSLENISQSPATKPPKNPSDDCESREKCDAPGECAAADSGSEPALVGASERGSGDAPAAAMTRDEITELMGSVCFGYGLFQLCVSLVPASLLKLVHMFGFDGHRDLGLRALTFASRTGSMTASLSMLSLLWYHTVVRPFFAVDGLNVRGGLRQSERILKEELSKHPESALLLFFDGRFKRIKGDIPNALLSFEAAHDASHSLREMQLIGLYEIAWCHLLELQWSRAVRPFARLATESRWARAYYAYMAAVCSAASADGPAAGSRQLPNTATNVADVEEKKTATKNRPKKTEKPAEACAKETSSDEMSSVDLFRLVVTEFHALRRRPNQMEIFANRRAKEFQESAPSVKHARLMCMELIYLWNALGTCSKDTLNCLLIECESHSGDEPLAKLVEGAIKKVLNCSSDAAECFTAAFEWSEEARHRCDQHVQVFALYEKASLMLHSEDENELTECRDILTKAKDEFHGYDFENRLHVRVHAALKSIDHRLKKLKHAHE